MTTLVTAGVALLTFVAVLLVLVVLLQKSRSTGLFSNAGAVGVGNRTTAVMWVTNVAFGVFLVLAVLLNVLIG